MGYCLYGNDIDDKTSPLEAGLGWDNQDSQRISQAKHILEEQKLRGVSQKLVDLKWLKKASPGMIMNQRSYGCNHWESYKRHPIPVIT
jgi:aminomethyltransferase